MGPVLNPFYDIQAFAKESVRHLLLKRFFTKVFQHDDVCLMPIPNLEDQASVFTSLGDRVARLCPRSPGGSGTSGLPLPVPTYVGPWADKDIKGVLNYRQTSKSAALYFIIRCGQMEQEMVCGVTWPWMLRSWGLVQHTRGLRITHTWTTACPTSEALSGVSHHTPRSYLVGWPLCYLSVRVCGLLWASLCSLQQHLSTLWRESLCHHRVSFHIMPGIIRECTAFIFSKSNYK